MSTTPSANNPPPPGLPPVSDMKASDGVFTESLRVMGTVLGGLTLDKGAVSQLTNPNTDVVLNYSSGIITTQSLTAFAAGATPNTFTVTNSSVSAGSVVLVSINTYAGGGNPLVTTSLVVDGAFDVTISSVSEAAALDAVMTFGFMIV